MNIVVVGLGKIGLPLAVQYASSGHHVVGVDIDPRVVDYVNRGTEPFPGEYGLAERLDAEVTAGRLSATSDTAAAVCAAEVVVVVVPLFVSPDGEPAFGLLDAATADIARGLQPGTLVCYETTLPVGTTRGRFRPQLELGSRLAEGEDFHLAFSPERVLTGRVFADLRRYPKLVGGLSAAGTTRAIAFYAAVLQFDDRTDLTRPNGVWDLGSAEAAELAKLAETTYRDVNIGLVNQFSIFADRCGIDIYQVIEAANSQPYSHLHYPGIAVGGHCIPVYPRLYLWNDPGATVVQAARQANAAMPAYTVGLARGAFGDLTGARVVVMGAAYRGGVKETAFSGVFPTVDALVREGADVTVHDPLFSPDELRQLGLKPHSDGAEVDVAIVQSDHAEYAQLAADQLPGVAVIVDGRRIVDHANFPAARIIRIGSGEDFDISAAVAH